MKKDLDRYMQEENVDALWVIGNMYSNPDMVYFTGIHHTTKWTFSRFAEKSPSLFISLIWNGKKLNAVVWKSMRMMKSTLSMNI